VAGETMAGETMMGRALAGQTMAERPAATRTTVVPVPGLALVTARKGPRRRRG
jgi:hypothetical protein